MKPHRLRVTDISMAGRESRILFQGLADIPGSAPREILTLLQNQFDTLRHYLLKQSTVSSNRSIVILFPSLNAEICASYLIMDSSGYPVYSGFNTLCAATAAIELGLIEKKEGMFRFKMESPASLVTLQAETSKGMVQSISSAGLPSYVEQYKQEVNIPLIGRVIYSLIYSGGLCVLVEASQLGLSLSLDEELHLTTVASQILEAVSLKNSLNQLSVNEQLKISNLHFIGPIHQKSKGAYAINTVSYTHPGVISHGPSGRGASALLALMQLEGRIEPGETLEVVSMDDGSFIASYLGYRYLADKRVIDNKIRGKSPQIKHSSLIVDDTWELFKRLR